MPHVVFKVTFAYELIQFNHKKPALQTEVVKFERCWKIHTPRRKRINKKVLLVESWEMKDAEKKNMISI